MPSPDKNIHRAGVAFVHELRRLSASAYCLRVSLRPTRDPCSVQAPHYGLAASHSRRRRRKSTQFAIVELSTFPQRFVQPVERRQWGVATPNRAKLRLLDITPVPVHAVGTARGGPRKKIALPGSLIRLCSFCA